MPSLLLTLFLLPEVIDNAVQDSVPQPARILVYVQSYGFTHAVAKRSKPGADSYVDSRIRLWADSDPRLEITVSQDPTIFHPVKLMDFDAVFFYTTGELPLDEPAKRALLSFVRDGGGFVGSHCATDTFYQWEDYGLMLGGYFDGHPWHQKVRVRVEDPSHPAVAHIPDGFELTDEIYQFKSPWSRDRVHVLMSLDTESVDMTRNSIRRGDGDFAISWTREEGKGRVFYTSLGHRDEVWRAEWFRNHLVEGLLWAAGKSPEKTEEILRGCKRCKERGVVDCNRHPKDLRQAELEEGVFCTEAARCKKCQGAMVLPCQKCDGGPETASMERRRHQAQAWLARESKLETILNRPLRRLEAPGVELVFEARSLKKKKKRSDPHAFSHHLLGLLRQTRSLIDKDFGTGLLDTSSPTRTWIWETAKDHLTTAEGMLGIRPAGDFKWLGHQPVHSIWSGDLGIEGDAEAAESNAVHNAAHMVISMLRRDSWIGDRGGGWFDAGAGHAYEEAVLGSRRNYCVEETNTVPDYAGGRWEPAIRKFLASNPEVIIPRLVDRQTGELTPREHALCWSLFEWLRKNHTQALSPILSGLQSRKPARNLFREHVGMDLLAADATWRAWVAEAYAPSTLKGR
ncbi:MAG TPA: hypothetical protein DDW23_08730 [Planctomycetes bacterium]|nr:hypothetical protein [Planctomycetota bacterium]